VIKRVAGKNECFCTCSPLVCSWSFSFKMPVVVGKHYLVAFFHDGDIFVNSLTLLITEIFKVAWFKKKKKKNPDDCDGSAVVTFGMPYF